MDNHLNEFEFNLLRVIFISEKKQGTKEIFLPSATKFLRKIHPSFASPYIPHDIQNDIHISKDRNWKGESIDPSTANPRRIIPL